MRTIHDEDPAGVAFDNVRVLRASAKAMLCEIEGEEHWFPLSQIHDDSEVFVDENMVVQGSPGRLVVTHWIAEKNGLV